MKKGLIFIILILLVVPCVFAQETVNEQIEVLTDTALEYERGNLNYAQLMMLSNLIKEEINSNLGEFKFEEHGPSGITAEAAEDFFGRPQHYTKHAWSMNEERDVFLDEALPSFEKVLFDGHKIKITFNAWPHVLTADEEITVFYWTDFRVIFKNDFDLDPSEMVSAVKSIGTDFSNGQASASDVASTIQEYQSVLNSYLEENRDNCESSISSLFSEAVYEEERDSYTSTIYEGDNLNFIIGVQTPNCDNGCEWPWINLWGREEFFGGMYPEDEQNYYEPNYEEYEFKDYTIEELETRLGDLLNDIYRNANQVDEGRGSMSSVYASVEELRFVVEHMLEKSVWQENGNIDSYNDILSRLINSLSEYDSPEKETVTEKRWENKLVENTVSNQDAWCREISYEKCDITQDACIEGGCTNALGGAEICDDGLDNDGDTVTDCDDPDCANECGRICEPVCEESCWSCHSENCQSTCNECWDCDWETEDCNVICDSTGCNECINNCKSQDFCSACVECEGSQQSKSDCSFECDPCEECKVTYSDDPEACIDECQTCSDCLTPYNAQCYSVCESISETGSQEEICKSLCDQNVNFYCGGGKQDYPCEDTTYICDGTSQPFPCTIYTCQFNGEEVKQTVPCDESSICGENQILKDEICVCQSGYYDCDGDATCESQESCGGASEICDDGIDNDDDYLADCSDLADCRLQSCGESLICYEGECQDESITSICEENQKLLEGECVGVCEFNEDCSEGYFCEYGLCTLQSECEIDSECSYGEICVDNYCVTDNPSTGETCTLASDCTNPSEVCANGVCVDLEVEMYCGDNICDESEIGICFEDCFYDIVCGDNVCDSGEEGTCPEDCGEEEKIPETEPIEEVVEEEVIEEEVIEEEIVVEEPVQEEVVEEVQEETAEPAQDEITGMFSAITGYFFKVTGNYYQEGDFCESDDACNANQNCDTFQGNCYCEYGYTDCNSNNGQGYDEDGCESSDATCGGEREICGGGCGENQYCDDINGGCECEEGYYNCDGVWWTCESTEQCQACTSNDDCAEPICDQNNPSVVLNYGCFQGGSWTEEKGAISFSGGCTKHADGQVDSYLSFNTWGEPFDEINQYQNGFGHNSWCEWELENALKQREELEASLNTELFDWYFTNYVNPNSEEWQKYISSVYEIYWVALVDNTRQLAMSSQCLDQEFPEVNPISVSYEDESSTGEIHIYEEWGYVDQFDLDMYTPYMEVWIFPPEEFLKQEFANAMAEGTIPGPKRVNPDEFQYDPIKMEDARYYLEDYGPKDGVIRMLDGDEEVYVVAISVSEENLLEVMPGEDFAGQEDLSVTIEFDFIYNMISTTEKELRVESPEWIDRGFGDVFQETVTRGKQGAMFVGAIATGDIRVSSLADIGAAMDLMGLAFDSEGDRGDEEERDDKDREEDFEFEKEFN